MKDDTVEQAPDKARASLSSPRTHQRALPWEETRRPEEQPHGGGEGAPGAAGPSTAPGLGTSWRMGSREGRVPRMDRLRLSTWKREECDEDIKE